MESYFFCFNPLHGPKYETEPLLRNKSSNTSLWGNYCSRFKDSFSKTERIIPNNHIIFDDAMYDLEVI